MKFLITVFLSLCVVSCGNKTDVDQLPTPSLKELKKSGVLRVITRNAPTTYYLGRDTLPKGPEYDMAEAFASSLDLRLEIIERDSLNGVIEALIAGEGDIAAAGLTITKARQKSFRFGPVYQDVTQQVVCRRDKEHPESIEELPKYSIAVPANTSYGQALQTLKKNTPDLKWEEVEDTSTEKLLKKVWAKKLDCTVADSNIVDLNRRFYPELMAPFNLTRSESLAWIVPKNRSDLQKAINTWFEEFENSGRLEKVMDYYYGFFEVFDYVDTRKYIERIHKRFPKYNALFKQAAEKYELPYSLLVAQAYQESHWRADAKSPTGVRGIMMLTQNTAKAMGVTNRLDAKQSIFGGAKYFAKIRSDRFSDEVLEPDRTWLALAAYNIGRAHLHDAQSLAREQGLNPYLWRDMKQVLPLLSDKKYYKKLKYGYARGEEPVRYVQRIREYQHIFENELKNLK